MPLRRSPLPALCGVMTLACVGQASVRQRADRDAGPAASDSSHGPTAAPDAGAAPEANAAVDAEQPPDAGAAPDGGGAREAGDPVADGARGGPPAAGAWAPDGTALFCEGFEGELGPAWTAYDGTYMNGCAGHSSGVGRRDTARSHGGAASWHAKVDYIDLESCQAELRRDVVVPAPDAFARMFVYLPAPTTAGTAKSNSFEVSMLVKGHGGFAAIGASLAGGVLAAEGYGDVAVPSGGGAAGASVRDAVALPTDRWVCVEWQLHQGSSPTFTAWRDGEAAITALPLTIAPGQPPEPFDRIFFGIYGYNNSGPVEVWLDDIALSATRIGCN